MKDTSLTVPLAKQKSGKKRSRKKKQNKSTMQDENFSAEVEEEHMRKKIKKIKIRLVDPNCPDSYICEMFDSSLERDEEDLEDENKRTNSFEILKEKTKPKNYFDVLMSKEPKRNVTINNVLQNEDVAGENRMFREIKTKNLIRKKKNFKHVNKEKVIEVVNVDKNEKDYCSSASDDESLFQVQCNLKLFQSNHEKNDSVNQVCIIQDKTNENENFQDDNLGLVKKNNSNILSYFSKKERVAKKRNKVNVNSVKLIEGLEVVKFQKVSEKKEVVKLAPLFQRKTKKVIDPNLKKARLEFLQNGLPTIMKKICSERKNLSEKDSLSYFPIISHVQQKDDDPIWLLQDPTVPLLKTPEEVDVLTSTNKTFRYQIKNEPKCCHLTDNKRVENNMNSLKLKYDNVNVNILFESFKEKRDDYLKKVEACSLTDSKQDCNDSVEIVEVIDDREGCNSLWTDIYKPKSNEIIGNKQTVAKLSGWLKSWQEYNKEISKSSGRDRSTHLSSGEDSSDDFITEDTNIRLRAPKNICFISGPIGSGKTALVYALASELDYNVLEVNASSKRTGKKLLLDLQEATKSHQVNGILTGSSIRKQEELKNVRLKRKKKKKNEMETDMQSNSKISLILIEDADIYFEEHDDGFVSAIITLVQSSKRPFIFLSNEPNYGYLERLKVHKALILEMTRPSFQNSCEVLDIIATLEGVNVEKENLEELIKKNSYDLRKSILELQFWIQSRKDLKQCRTFELGKLWWGLNKFLYMRENIHCAKLNHQKRKRVNDLYDLSSDECEDASKRMKLSFGNVKTPILERKTDDTIHNYSKILDTISVIDLLKLGGGGEPIPWIEFRPKDSLSLQESMESADWKARNFSKSIAKELISVSANLFSNRCRNGRDSNCVLGDPSWEEIRWRNMQRKAKKELMSLIPFYNGNNTRAVHSDYLPALRNMCRTEKSRYFGNTKRKNRFYHYFRNLGFDSGEDLLDVSCDILEY